MTDEHQEFEFRLRTVAAEFAYPPTPDLKATVRQEPRVVRPRLAWAVALLAVIVVVVLGVPPVRAALTEVLGMGSVRITLGAPTPTTLPGQLSLSELPGETTLPAARAASSVHLPLPGYPSDLGPPDRVFLLERVGDAVVFVWEADHRAHLALYVIPPGSIIEKLGPQTVEQTRVGDAPALWTTGDHFLELVSGDPSQRFLVSGNVLIWTENGVTYRLETELPISEAIRIGESLR